MNIELIKQAVLSERAWKKHAEDGCLAVRTQSGFFGYEQLSFCINDRPICEIGKRLYENMLKDRKLIEY